MNGQSVVIKMRQNAQRSLGQEGTGKQIGSDVSIEKNALQISGTGSEVPLLRATLGDSRREVVDRGNGFGNNQFALRRSRSRADRFGKHFQSQIGVRANIDCCSQQAAAYPRL